MTDTQAVDRRIDPVPHAHDVEEVVVGFDGTPESETALRWAAGEAVALGAFLTVLHAIETPGLARSRGRGGELHAALSERSATVAHQGAQLARAAEPTLRVGSIGVVGGAAAELIAHSASADLLVVGRRRRGHVLAAALGSVSFAVSMHARCPVVVCPTGATVGTSSRPVVVGVDGSSGSTAALDLAGTLAAATGSAVTVVGAFQGSSAGGGWDEAFPPPTHMSGAAAAAAARDEVATAVLHLRARHPDLQVEGTTVEGDAVDVLVAASSGVAAVVVGSRGYGGFAGMMLGSVSHGVLRAAMSPVAVVRRGAFA